MNQLTDFTIITASLSLLVSMLLLCYQISVLDLLEVFEIVLGNMLYPFVGLWRHYILNDVHHFYVPNFKDFLLNVV